MSISMDLYVKCPFYKSEIKRNRPFFFSWNFHMVFEEQMAVFYKFFKSGSRKKFKCPPFTRVRCPLCRLTQNFTVIAVLYDIKSLDESLSDKVLWLVCAYWYNSEVTKLESTMLINNIRRLYTRRGYHYERIKSFSLISVDQSIINKIHKLLSRWVDCKNWSLAKECQGRPKPWSFLTPQWFRWMSRWTLHLSAFATKVKDSKTSAKLLSTAYWGKLQLWEKWNPLRYYVI